jgi:hypothetical protein
MLTEREITVLRVALMQKCSRLLNDIPDHSDTAHIFPVVATYAEMYNELRDLLIKLGKMRDRRERITTLLQG